jgi:hypothetical protein
MFPLLVGQYPINRTTEYAIAIVLGSASPFYSAGNKVAQKVSTFSEPFHALLIAWLEEQGEGRRAGVEEACSGM